MLALDKEHKKVFPEVPIVGFRNGKSLKECLVRAALPKMDNAGESEPCGKSTCQVCDHIITTNTFTTNACWEVFKIQSGPLNCNSEKVFYLLRCNIWDDTHYVWKAKTKFCFRFIIIKVNTDLFEKENRTYHRSVFIYTIFKIAIEVLMTLFQKCETHKQLKERETFWQQKLKTFYPLLLFSYSFIKFICLLVYLFFYLFIYLLILYLFQWQQNIRRLIFHFLFNSLCTCVHSIFINHHPSFLISSFHPSIGGEFKTLSSSGLVYPYPSIVWVSRIG